MTYEIIITLVLGGVASYLCGNLIPTVYEWFASLVLFCALAVIWILPQDQILLQILSLVSVWFMVTLFEKGAQYATKKET